MDAAHPRPFPLTPPSGDRAAPRWSWRTPILTLALYCLISVLLKENYPFSHFPMYANPSADRAYYVIADAATGKPLPIAEASGVTSPKIGKNYRKQCEELEAKLKIRKNEITPAQQQAIGVEIFKQLRQSAKDTGSAGLPARLLLQRIDILWRNDTMTEQPTTIATE